MTQSDDSSCRPAPGNTYLTIGQDLFSVQEYTTSLYNASLHAGSTAPLSTFTPAAFMVYTSLFSIENGTSLPTDYGSGIEYADGLVDDLFPGQDIGLQIGLWLEGSEGCDKINTGTVDTQIVTLARYLRTSNATKIFLRIGYEFDNPSFGFSSDPTSYREAFRRIVTNIRHQWTKDGFDDETKVQFVWHSWAAPRAGNLTLQDFYPGDEYVDWIGVSIFQQMYEDRGEGGSVTNVKDVLDFAFLNGKPTMIAESSPFGGFSSTTPWDYWYSKVIKLIKDYDISMWSYINCDWDSLPLWHDVGFGESRVSANEEVTRRWRDEVLSEESRFLGAGSLLDCGGEESPVVQLESLSTSILLASRFHREWYTATIGVVVCLMLLLTRKVLRTRWQRVRCSEYDFESVPLTYSTKKESMNVMGLDEGRIILSRCRNTELQLSYM